MAVNLLLLCSFPVWAQGDAGDYLTIVGMVKDKQNKKSSGERKCICAWQ